MRTMPEIIDEALALGKGLDSKEIEYLIKAITIEEFGNDALAMLKKANLKLTEDDREGIKRANKRLEDIVNEVLFGTGQNEIDRFKQ